MEIYLVDAENLHLLLSNLNKEIMEKKFETYIVRPLIQPQTGTSKCAHILIKGSETQIFVNHILEHFKEVHTTCQCKTKTSQEKQNENT